MCDVNQIVLGTVWREFKLRGVHAHLRHIAVMIGPIGPPGSRKRKARKVLLRTRVHKSLGHSDRL